MRAWQWALCLLLALTSSFFQYVLVAYIVYLLVRQIKWPRSTPDYPAWNAVIPKSDYNRQAVYCVLRQLSWYEGYAGVARAVNKYTWTKDTEIRENWFNQRAEFCAKKFQSRVYYARHLPRMFEKPYDFNVPGIFKIPKDTMPGLYRLTSAGALLNWSHTVWISFHAERSHGKVRVSKYFGHKDVLFVVVSMSRDILYVQKVSPFDILRE